jgi:hypothetical protein
VSALDPQALALGFFTVIGLGLLAIYAGIHLRRVNTAQRIRDRYLASRRVQGLYLETEPFPEYQQKAARTGEVHVCNVNGNCAQGRAAR